ncbi:hypothetical protein J4E86_007614 [Alternaria arbusti]|uniref:uncharacterized protein n=1 Tax=Alternaria arbusti TaxID=232088 RepID=UPI00221FF36D|nr:uncharacterized protein J4E86_007614 [Alternaria arbusti]KAI4949663.1 hypothetical protein J4E86_007614 [Alternaria arbusti]
MSRLPSPGPDTFRFLDLPAELRLMVYEHIPNEVFRHEFPEIGATKKPGLSLQIAQVGIALLSTCRQIHMEVIEIIKRKQALAASIPIRIALTRWDERSVMILYIFYRIIYAARSILIGSTLIYAKLSLPGSEPLLSAFKRLIRGLPNIELVLDFPDMDFYAADMLSEIARYGCFDFHTTVRVPPGSISMTEFDLFQGIRGMVIIWDE